MTIQTATIDETRPAGQSQALTEYDIRSAIASVCAGFPFEAQTDKIAQAVIDNAMDTYGFLRRPFTPELIAAFEKSGVDVDAHAELNERIRVAFHHLRGLAWSRR